MSGETPGRPEGSTMAGTRANRRDEKGTTMSMYLAKFTQTPEVWARLLANPEDRRQTLAPLLESVGGKLHGYWYAWGDADGYILLEAPGDVAAASIAMRAASTGAFATISTTKLLTVEEALEAIGLGGDLSYRAPGAPGR